MHPDGPRPLAPATRAVAIFAMLRVLLRVAVGSAIVILRLLSNEQLDPRSPAATLPVTSAYSGRSLRVPRPLSHVAWRIGHTAHPDRDRSGRGRRLDRARCGGGREAHQRARSARREAAGHHADLLSRLGGAAHHRRDHRGGRPGVRRRGRVRAAAACRPALGRHRLRPHRPGGRKVRGHRLQADVRQTDRSRILAVRRRRAALGPPDAARPCASRAASACSTRRAR